MQRSSSGLLAGVPVPVRRLFADGRRIEARDSRQSSSPSSQVPHAASDVICPITLEAFTEPVLVTSTGQTYDLEALERYWLSQQVGRWKDPLSNEAVVDITVAPNWALRHLIKALTGKELLPPRLNAPGWPPKLAHLRTAAQQENAASRITSPNTAYRIDPLFRRGLLTLASAGHGNAASSSTGSTYPARESQQRSLPSVSPVHSHPLDLSVSLEHVTLGPNRMSTTGFVALQTSSAPPDAPRCMVHLVVVIDCSTSMLGRKMQQVKNGLEFLLEEVSATTHLSFVTFSSAAEIVLPFTSMTEEGKMRASTVLQQFQAAGATYLYEALEVARDMLQGRAVTPGATVLLLLSDGMASDRARDDHLMEAFRDLRVHMIAFGYGVGHDQDLMQHLGIGGYAFVENADDFALAVADWILPLTRLAATNVRLDVRVDGAPDRTICELEGPGNIGNLPYETQKRLMFELRLPQDLELVPTEFSVIVDMHYDAPGHMGMCTHCSTHVFLRDVVNDSHEISDGQEQVQVERLRVAAVQALISVQSGTLAESLSSLERALAGIRASNVAARELEPLVRRLREVRERVLRDARAQPSMHPTSQRSPAPTRSSASAATRMRASSDASSAAVRSPSLRPGSSPSYEQSQRISVLYSSGQRRPRSTRS